MFFNKKENSVEISEVEKNVLSIVHCAECGVLLDKTLCKNKVKEEDWKPLIGKIEKTKYYCEAHKKPYDIFISGGPLDNFKNYYCKTFQVDETGKIIK